MAWAKEGSSRWHDAVAWHLEVSEQTHHMWRNQYGGMKAEDAQRLNHLEAKNAQLKEIVADKKLDIIALLGIAQARLQRG